MNRPIHLFILIIFQYCLNGQVSIEPSVSFSFVWLSVEDSPEGIIIDLEHGRATQHGLGVSLNSKLFDKVSLNLQTQLNQVSSNSRYIHLDPPVDGGIDFASNLHRWDNALYISYFLKDKITFSIGGHAIYQPSIYGNYFGRGSSPYKVTEFGFGLRIKALIKKITISLEYYYGLGNRGGLFYRFDPLGSFGLRVGYPISLKH